MFDNQFIDVQLTNKNLDRYYIRSSIFKALKIAVPRFSGRLLDLGCGKMPYKEFILKNSSVETYDGLDIENALQYDRDIKPDYTWNGKKMPFEDNSYDCAFATEVLEHCPDPEVVLNEVFRVLKPNGVFFFTVPFLWNLHEVPNDEYRYTPFSLQRHLQNVGFIDISIEATGGWHASMAQMLGLWIKRSPMPEKKRKYLSLIIKPIIRYLIKMDKKSNIDFVEGQMITGLYGIAQK